ncbi:MAG: tetratricopeptide repeat protein [Elusimicrobia bacterium]|nr:tetratricopeptide repeat protein [Elusimicrobiota bacterium]
MKLILATVLMLSAAAARASKPDFDAAAEESGFNSATQMFQETGRDKLAVVQAFENFTTQFARSPRISDAEFLIGEAYMQHALSILKAEASAKKTSSARLLAPKNPAAVKALMDARKAYQSVLGDKKSGLAASAQYRLGEVAYNEKDWEKAVEEFKEVDRRYPKTYINPEALMGIIYADLALEQFSQAEANLFLLGETFPTFLKEPVVLYAQGIVALHKGDYASAERALKQVKTAEAQYYLGKTYLLSKRAYLAAAAFENLIRDYKDSDLKEEAQFFIGDSFFLAEDYNGAISKYQAFISIYPESPLRVSALFRIGSSYFQKKDYVEARANFQAVLDRYPKDFFAPLAQFFIAESHLVSGQVREALFAYTKVITQYPDAVKITPLAYFKLAWCQHQVGDFMQAIQTGSNFVAQYPNHVLAKNVYLIMANAQIALKRYVEATSSFQRIIDLAPSSDIAEQALFSILKNQYDQKAFNSILTSYQFIFRHLPPSKSKWRSMSYLYAAEAYLGMNQTDEAAVIYEMILKVYPDDPAAFYAQDGLAWCHSYKGEDVLALEARQKLKDMMAVATSSFSFSGLNELGIADSMFNQKNYEDSYQLYEKFARENPTAAEAPSALYRAAMSSYHQRFYTQAIDLWKKLVANYPQSKDAPMARSQIADTLFRAQKYGEAIAAYREIVAADPKGATAPLSHLRIAQAAYNAKDDAAAIKQVQELVAAFPSAPEANDGLDILEGVFDRTRGLDFKTSLRAIVTGQPGTPIGGEAQFRLARRAFEAKDWTSAAADFQKFSVEFTNHAELPKAQFYLGESFFNQQKWLDAIPAFERLLGNFEKSDDTPLAVFHLASAYYNLEKFDEATRHYSRLIEEYPSSPYVPPAQFNLALAYKKLGKLDMAQYAYQKYVAAAKPGDGQAQNALWETYQIQRDRKDFDGAIATLEQIKNSGKADGELALEVMYRISEVNVAAGRPDEAQTTWDKMRAMKPLNSPFRLQALAKLGEAYEKGGDFSAAADVYEDYARAAPKDLAQKAAARAAALRKAPGGAKTPKKAAVKATPDVDEAVPPEGGGTMVMPTDEAPKAKKPAKPAATKSDAKGRRGAGAQEPNLPGMPAAEDIH